MTIALAIFAKNPDLSPVKTRLAQDIGQEKAILFYRLCLQCIQETVSHIIHASHYAITPYWALAEQESPDLPQWQCFNTIWTGPGDLGERLHHVYSSLLREHEAVIMIGSDSPALPVELLLEAIEKTKAADDHVIIGPADDGGFFLFGGSNSIDQSVWMDTPYSSDNTLNMLKLQLQARHIPIVLLPGHLDVDSKNDLYGLQKILKDKTGARGIFLQLEKFIDEELSHSGALRDNDQPASR